MDLNRSVTFIILKLYNKNIAMATPNVNPTAFNIIFEPPASPPFNFSEKTALKKALMPPINRPSNIA